METGTRIEIKKSPVASFNGTWEVYNTSNLDGGTFHLARLSKKTGQKLPPSEKNLINLQPRHVELLKMSDCFSII